MPCPRRGRLDRSIALALFSISVAAITPIATASNTTRQVCAGTPIEFNIGVLSYWSGPYPGREDVIPAFVMFDWDFQATWNDTVRAKWGEPMFKYPNDLNPCLRVRWLLLDNKNVSDTNGLRAQVNGKWGVGDQPKIDGIVHDQFVALETSMHASVVGIPQIGMSSAPSLSLKRHKFPYYFRYAGSDAISARVMYEYYAKFEFRSLNIVYDTSSTPIDQMQYILGRWSKDGRDPDTLITANVPSYGVNFENATIGALLRAMAAGPTKVLLLLVDPGLKYVETFGWAFIELLYAELLKEGLHPPKVQMFGGEHVQYLLRDIRYIPVNGRFEPAENPAHDGAIQFNSSTHVCKNMAEKDPSIGGNVGYWLGVQDRLLANTSFWYNQGLVQRFGLDNFAGPFDHPTSLYSDPQYLAGLVAGVWNGPWPRVSSDLTMRLWFTDTLLYWVYALNKVMNDHMPTSKSEITAQMIADGIGETSPPQWTVYGGNNGYSIGYENNQEGTFVTAMTQYNSLAEARDNAGDIHGDAAPWRPFCCGVSSTESPIYDGYYRHGKKVFNNSVPHWASDPSINPDHNDSHPYVVSEMPPDYLRKCVAGMYQLKGNGKHPGMCAWCPAGTFSNETDQTACHPCPRGTKSDAKALKCTGCAPGRVASEMRSIDCTDCSIGTYAKVSGMSLCVLCERGSYTNKSAATSCNRCGETMTTASSASTMPEECLCDEGYFTRKYNSVESFAICESCGVGLDCSTDWPLSWNAKGSAVARTEKGFYSLSADPYSVYLCNHETDCPGGPPETCEGGRGDLVCDSCVKDKYFIDGEGCKECPHYLQLMMLFAVVAATCLITAGYYAANGRLAVNADNPLAFFLCAGLLVTSVQIFGILKNMSIPWPAELSDMMGGSSSAFSADANSVSIECAVGKKAWAAYLAQVLLPFGLLGLVLCLFGVSMVVSRAQKNAAIAWQVGKALNVCGQICQALFIAFCAVMVKPFQCYEHPNGKFSNFTFPRVLCYEGGQHTVMAILAAIICFFFILPFIAWCVWGCWKAPAKSSQKDELFLQSFRFLLYRFRPDYWWWGLPFLLRQTVLAFATVIPSDNPHAQLFYCGATCAVYGFAAARTWPWLARELSIIDTGCMLLFTLIMMIAGQFLPEAKADKGRFGLLVCLFCVLAAIFGWFACRIIASVLKRGLFGEFGGRTPERMDLAKMWLDWLESAQQMSNKEIVTTICEMNTFDRMTLLDAMKGWNAVVGQGWHGKPSRLEFLGSRNSDVCLDEAQSVAEKARLSCAVSRTGTVTETPEIKVLAPMADLEHNTQMPRTLRILASHGTTVGFPLKDPSPTEVAVIDTN